MMNFLSELLIGNLSCLPHHVRISKTYPRPVNAEPKISNWVDKRNIESSDQQIDFINLFLIFLNLNSSRIYVN